MPDDSTQQTLDVAVIGMSGRFPGAADPETLWENALAGRESITRFRPEELEEPPPASSRERFVPAGGIIEDAELFDAAFFGVSDEEAAVLNPQFRLFLEESWKAVERAGYVPDAYPGTGSVFAGSWRAGAGYLGRSGRLVTGRCATNELMSLTRGNETDFMPALVSSKLNLQGEVVAIQATCPSGLVALHFAVQSLLLGQSDLALAGAAAVHFPQRIGYEYEPADPFSSDGHTRCFDHRADGAAPGAGLAVVVLKRLDDALRDRDPLLGIVKGVSVNSDGARRTSYSAPSVEAQSQVIARALSQSEVDPASVSYLEANGLSTLSADSVEVEALNRAYGAAKGTRPGRCAMGSVKSNIGHPGTSSGICGLVRALLVLENRVAPPAVNFEAPNPDLRLERGPFYIPLEPRPLGDGRLRAAVNSFGGGGQNVHLLLESAPPRVRRAREPLPAVFVLSAKTSTALQQARLRLAAHLAREELDLEDVAYTLAVGRRAFPYHRSAVVAADRAALVAGLEGWRPRGLQGAPRSPLRPALEDRRDLGTLDRLAGAFESGAELDWADFFRGRDPGRVRLPTTVFEPRRYSIT